ncbi:MAG: hypothetical protein ACRD3J_02865, partial [Thermoanaerobaculia bacterium]
HLGFIRATGGRLVASFVRDDNAFLAAAGRARRSSDRALVVAELAGFSVALAIVFWSPRAWIVALPAVALGALGLWGITDHMIDARRKLIAPLRWILFTFRFLVATAGVVAVLATGYAIAGIVMGTWIL